MKNKTKKPTDAQSFFLILLFAIAGFTVVMISILSGASSLNNYESGVVPSNESHFELVAKEVVLQSSIFQDFSDGLLIHESKKNLGCLDCLEFSFKFSVVESDELPSNINGFRFIIKIIDGEIKSTEVFELVV